MQKQIRGINILNPVRVDGEYYEKAVDFAIKNNYNHIQLNGPIHEFRVSNCDGMVFYKKYSMFNGDKDADYVNYCMDVVNKCLKKSHDAGIKTYMWHHELEVPSSFTEVFPEVLNDLGDVELTHPILRDFIENKFKDFFEAYPYMDGIVITYFESKIPILRLKNQKLPTEKRMEYVTRLLYETLAKLGKEMIVRPDCPLEEDMLTLIETYDKVSTDMISMNKWTPGDWCLTLPQNDHIRLIKNSPLLIETDIFGEYAGKDMVPIMLKNEILTRGAYCEQFNPAGYCNRIDRAGRSSFGTVNEVNLHIMKAFMEGGDIDKTIDNFFNEKYGDYGAKVKSVMELTEDIMTKTYFAAGYYYSELSKFPTIYHCKNHFYFEFMKDDYSVVSEEWFVPPKYVRPSLEQIFSDLEDARQKAVWSFEVIKDLQGKISQEDYRDLFVKFKNQELVGKIWPQLFGVFYNYAKYFEYGFKPQYKTKLYEHLDMLESFNKEGQEVLGNQFMGMFDDRLTGGFDGYVDTIGDFVRDVKKCFVYEEKTTVQLQQLNATDFIVCGGCCEGHKINKETNFSDSIELDGEFVRITGNKRGKAWSYINAHGPFGYEIKVKPNSTNVISFTMGCLTPHFEVGIVVGDKKYVIKEEYKGKKQFDFEYAAGSENAIRVTVEKISDSTPCAYTIVSKGK